MKEIKPKLLFKYEEYVSNWSMLMSEYYARLVSDENVVFLKNRSEYQVNVSVFIPTIMKVMLTNESKISGKIILNLVNDTCVDYFDQIFSNMSLSYSEWDQYYQQQTVIYTEVLKVSANNASGNSQQLGISKMLTNIVTIQNQSEQELVVRVSQIIQDMMQSFLKLATNSGVVSKMIGKPNFVIQRD